ncbi:DUF2207 family protein [uncultured Cohaesibacter sp.]|uniref:DUF2207 family protein n=1 Tax=uncultured Cohaesibacter sp. TaxID=1002546 RepID=UPI002D1E46C2|nr:hypothetical protein [uncultured Cohaesibacter sp.]
MGTGSFTTGNQSTFMAALIDLAVKRRIVLDDTESKLVVRKEESGSWRDAGTRDLPPGERALFQSLLGRKNSATFADMKYKEMAPVMKAFHDAINAETDQVYFRRNLPQFLIGLAIAVIGAAAYVIASKMLAAPFIYPLFEFVGAAFLVVIITLLHALWRNIRGQQLGVTVRGAFITVFCTIFFGIWFVVLADDGRSLELGFQFLRITSILLLTIGILLLVYFSDWMKAPTILGRKMMDEIEGLKLFMTVTVAEQAKQAHAAGMPELTPKLYEDLLPYAIALGIEQDWSDVFEKKIFSQLPPERSYRPSWYRGDSFNSARPAASLAGITTALNSGLTSALTPPASSSSGSGGGGSSGGGGGGGGGGGW